METIQIINDDFKAFIHFNKNKLFGYKFYNDNTFEPIDNTIISYFNFLKLSNNKAKLKNHKKYEVYLDNETNYKHYFYKDKEDYNMFFDNNGDNGECYKKSPYKRKTGTKVFYYKGSKIYIRKNKLSRILIILIVLMATTGVSSAIIANNVISKNKITQAITLDELSRRISASTHLSEEDKEFLFNEEYLELVLPIVNESNANRYQYLLKFSDIDLVRYDREEDSNVIGWYSPAQPNVINIDVEVDDNKTVEDVQLLNAYIFLNKKFMPRKDTIAHEFIHLTQIDHSYHLLVEACAEIISTEFFNYTKTNTYFEEVRLAKKLMEIIGPDPIWYYNFSGSFQMIEDAVKPFLTDDEYGLFKFCLTTSTSVDEDELFTYKASELDKLLNILYFNKYGKLVAEDEAIYALDNHKIMDRYYFNPKYIHDKERSYYYDNEMNFEEAFNNGYMLITYKKNGGEEKSFSSFQEYIERDEDPEYDVRIKFSDDVTVRGAKVIHRDYYEIIPLVPIGEKDFSIGLTSPSL